MTQHRWTVRDRTPCCELCGIVKRADGKNKPCSGRLPAITVRVNTDREAQAQLLAALAGASNAPRMQKPLVGDSVHFNTGHGPHAATIVAVHGDRAVNLDVCNEGGTHYFKASVSLFDTEGDAPTAGTWSWRPAKS